MKRIFVAGHRGMVGSAICRQLVKKSDVEIITCNREELDLCDQRAVHQFMKSAKPDEVILAAAKVGGIHANNTYPGEFIYQNLQIQSNVIHAAHINDVQKLLFLGSSCIYPRAAEQPMREDALLTGILEPTNEPYAIAKIAGIKMCESYNRQYGRDYRSVMPTNLYGLGDNYHPENSHVVPALIRRFHEAKVKQETEVVVWGSGRPRREFLYVDDMAEASLFLLNLDKKILQEKISPLLSHVNVGFGSDITIEQLAQAVRRVVGYTGEIVFDQTRPDGTPKKLMDVTLLSNLGFDAKVPLDEGLRRSYLDFSKNYC